MNQVDVKKLTRAIWALTITTLIVLVIEFGFLFSFLGDIETYLNPQEPYDTFEELYLAADYEQLREKAGARLTTHPNDEYSYYYLGKMHFRLKEWSQAREYFEKSLEIDPDWDSAQEELDYVCKQINCT